MPHLVIVEVGRGCGAELQDAMWLGLPDNAVKESGTAGLQSAVEENAESISLWAGRVKINLAPSDLRKEVLGG